MGVKKSFILAIGLTVFWFLSITIFRGNLGSRIRIFNDDYDRSDYALRGTWVLHMQVPYRDTPSEYPQIPTYMFALPYLFLSFFPGNSTSYVLYSAIFSFLMFVFLFLTVNILYRMLPNQKNLAFLLLLPAGLYFSFNRFDVLPSLLVLLTLTFFQRRQTIIAGIFLAIATLTKWYPVLLLPVFLSFTFFADHRFDLKMLLAFSVTCLLILLPTLLLGGLNALLQPYLFHGSRGLESVSLPALMQLVFDDWFHIQLNTSLLINISFALSILPVLICLMTKNDKYQKVLNWCVVIISAFMLFSRIYSPQWILWLMPLLILISSGKSDIVWIVFYDLWTYFSFPVIYDMTGANSWPLQVMGVINIVFLARMMMTSFRRIKFELVPKLQLKTLRRQNRLG